MASRIPVEDLHPVRRRQIRHAHHLTSRSVHRASGAPARQAATATGAHREPWEAWRRAVHDAGSAVAGILVDGRRGAGGRTLQTAASAGVSRSRFSRRRARGAHRGSTRRRRPGSAGSAPPCAPATPGCQKVWVACTTGYPAVRNGGDETAEGHGRRAGTRTRHPIARPIGQWVSVARCSWVAVRVVRRYASRARTAITGMRTSGPASTRATTRPTGSIFVRWGDGDPTHRATDGVVSCSEHAATRCTRGWCRMDSRGRTFNGILDWVNRLTLRGVRNRALSADEVRHLSDTQRADEVNRDRQVWIHGSMNGRH